MGANPDSAGAVHAASATMGDQQPTDEGHDERLRQRVILRERRRRRQHACRGPFDAVLPCPARRTAARHAAGRTDLGGARRRTRRRTRGRQPRAAYAARAEPGGGTGEEPTAVVKGRIKIEDRVVEKVAALAALEVTGVAALAGEVPGAEAPGVKASVRDTEVSVDVTVVVDYGSVVMDVAKTVKNNVARVVGVMLGLKVTEVNVTVDDVRMPGSEA